MGLLRLIGNILWFIGGGLISFLTWLLLGVGLCITIIGIPFGIQCLKFATLVLAPFGKEVVYGGKTGSFLMNILWLPLGLVLCLEQVALGLLYCITIIGIPAGLQAFKMAKLALMPFGAEVRKIGSKPKAVKEKPAPAAESAPAEPAQPTPTQPTLVQPIEPTVASAQPAAATPQPTVTATAEPVAEPITEPTPTQAQVPTPAEPTPAAPVATEPPAEPTEKSRNFSPTTIIVIIVGVVAVLGIGLFMIMPFFMGNTVKDLPMSTLESVERPAAEVNPNRIFNVGEIEAVCVEDFGGEYIPQESIQINAENSVEKDFCRLSTDPETGFFAYIAGLDYQTIMEAEAAETGEAIDPDDYSTTVADYVNRVLDLNSMEATTVTATGETVFNFTTVFGNLVLRGVGLDDIAMEDVMTALGIR